VVSVPGLRLMIHEFRLYTSILRLLTGRWRHGVRKGDIAVRYASGGAGLLLTLVYLSVIETVVLAFLIPWPLVREITLALDVWGVFFILGLFASFVVRPHVIGADGTLRLRSGALVDIRIPGQDIAAVRVERRTARGKKGAVDDDGCADLSQGGQTTVTSAPASPNCRTCHERSQPRQNGTAENPVPPGLRDALALIRWLKRGARQPGRSRGKP
jgi:hypothetical protein